MTELRVASQDAPRVLKRKADFVCQSETDNEAELYDAANALGDNGGGIILSPGPFMFGEAFKLKSGIHIAGSGIGATVVTPDPEFDGNLFELDDVDVNYFSLRGMTLDGDKDNHDNGSGIKIDKTNGALGTSSSSHSFLIDLLIQNFEEHGVWSLGVPADGSGARGLVLREVNSYKNDGHAFYIQAPDHKFVTCTAGNNGRRGFSLTKNAANAQLTTCKAFGNGQIQRRGGMGAGYYISSGRIGLVMCSAQDNFGSGFRLKGYDGFLTGCIADSNGRTTARFPGISIGGKRIALVGCQSFDRFSGEARKQTYGVQLAANADYVRLNLTAFNNYIGPFLDGGASNVINEIAEWQ